MIQIDSVVTTLETRSDGVTAQSSGSTAVSGLTVNGQGFVVDEKGIRPAGDDEAAAEYPDFGAGTDLLRTLGLGIEPVKQQAESEGASASRLAEGLVISVDTVALRAALNEHLPPEVNDTLGEVFGEVPQVPGAPIQPQGLLFYSLSATPKITFILGQADTAAAASLPLNLDFPSLDLPTFDGALGGSSGFPGTPGTPGTPGLPGTPVSSITGPVSGPAGGSGDVPVVAAASRERPDPFGGLPLMLVLTGLFLAGAGARGLLALQGAALGGGLLGAGCPLGAPDDLPDLRTDGTAEERL
jgi:hypothetical protein